MATRIKPAGCCVPRRVKPLSRAASESIAAVGKALSDPNRIEILRLLAAQDGAVCACDIVDHVDLSQPTVSHHLRVLKDAGLLTSRRKGLWVFYEAKPAGLGVLDCLGEAVGS